MWDNTPIEIPKDLTESQIELSRKSIAMQTALDIKESNPSNTDSVEELMKLQCTIFNLIKFIVDIT